MGEVIDYKDIMIGEIINNMASVGNEDLMSIAEDALALVQTEEEVKVYAAVKMASMLTNAIVEALETEHGYSDKDIDFENWFPSMKAIGLV